MSELVVEECEVGYLSELELLFNVWNDCLALQTEEGARDKLRVDGMCAHHLPTDLQ